MARGRDSVYATGKPFICTFLRSAGREAGITVHRHSKTPIICNHFPLSYNYNSMQFTKNIEHYGSGVELQTLD